MERLRPPPPHGVLREGLWVLELPRLLWNAPELAAQPRGRGETVLVLPGYGASDSSTALLRAYLRYLGYRVRGWGLGRNTGDVPALLPRVAALARESARSAGAPVRLVGWSLGGYLAREAAREHPEAVARVVTLGSPVTGGPKYTAMARWMRPLGVDLDAIEVAVAARESVPLRVPVTAVYSKRDGIVGWRACVDACNRDVEHVEVRTTHLGLGFAPEVYRVVARRLAGQG
jgi:pimeloyl-ACP methyl ester carboxylesterase